MRQINTLIQAFVWVTARSCFAQRSMTVLFVSRAIAM
jgi:hypothetical protein